MEYYCDLFEYFISLVFPFSFQIDGEAQAVNKPSFFKLHPLNKSTFCQLLNLHAQTKVYTIIEIEQEVKQW